MVQPTNGSTMEVNCYAMREGFESPLSEAVGITALCLAAVAATKSWKSLALSVAGIGLIVTGSRILTHQHPQGLSEIQKEARVSFHKSLMAVRQAAMGVLQMSNYLALSMGPEFSSMG